MSDAENLDRFCEGLKPQISFEVLKVESNTMKIYSRIAINVDGAIFGS